MQALQILIIGGGIGGLTSAIALRGAGFDVAIIERDPDWSVYGVGIIQQSNVVRAMKQLDLLDDYLDAGFGYEEVAVHLPNGQRVATLTSPTLTEGYPANVGIGRRALHKVLCDRTIALGADIRLGVVATAIEDAGDHVAVAFSDGTSGNYDLVIGADGLYSQTRKTIFPEISGPEFTGQAVWRYNFRRPDDVIGMHVYEGPTGIGLVPLSQDLMYMYVTTPEPDNPRYPRAQLASVMRDRLAGAPPAIAALVDQIADDGEVVYKPLEWLLLEGDWHKGRIVLLGDAVHGSTPHLGQGAGMAIEDSIVLAEELVRADTPEAAFRAYRDRRFDRCAYIVRQSLAICQGQIGKGPRVDQAKATHDMFAVTAAEI
ncbi:MAG TPA: FAD-dependent oxidoreductase [Sphingomicrobium sp.]|jgi:2-polyprenyl-6-methoxyphenol hydroxylase-like FAD-dependent oxidoreductase